MRQLDPNLSNSTIECSNCKCTIHQPFSENLFKKAVNGKIKDLCKDCYELTKGETRPCLILFEKS